MAAMTLADFPQVDPSVYNRLGPLRKELLAAFQHAAANPASKVALMDFIEESVSAGVLFLEAGKP